MDRYEVFPKGDGWNWRLRKNERSAKTGDGYGSRGGAIVAAREANPGDLALVLVRGDGTDVGELDGPRSTAAAQQMQVEAAGETNRGGQ